MFRNLSIVCRRIKSIPKINYRCEYPCVSQNYDFFRTNHSLQAPSFSDGRKSFASNVSHPLEVLELIPSEPDALSTTDISGIFQDLLRTHTENPCELSAIQNHQNFPILSESTKHSLEALYTPSSPDLVAILKTVQQFGLPVEHDLTQSILRAILHQVSTLRVDDIFTLDRLIRRAYDKDAPNALHVKLLLILPMVYQVNHLDRIDYENIDELCTALKYISCNSGRLSRRAVSGVVTSLRITDANIRQEHAIQIIASLARLKLVDSHIEPLLKKCIEIVADAPLTPNEIDILLDSLSQFNITLDGFDERFGENCVQRLIQEDCDVILACSIRKKFNERKFSSNDLLDFIFMKLPKYAGPLPIYEIFGLIMNLSSAKHKPPNWDDEIMPMIQKVNWCNQVEQHAKVDWPRFAKSLIQLGYHDPLLVEKILKSDLKSSFQQNYPETFRRLERMSEKENEFSSLEKVLTQSIGENKVLSNVTASDDCYINYVLKIDCKTGEFSAFGDFERKNKSLSLDQIHCETNEQLIGIIPSGLPPFLRQKLMSLDLVMVPIDLRKWSTLPEYMKLTEIFQRITKHIEKYKEIANAKPRN